MNRISDPLRCFDSKSDTRGGSVGTLEGIVSFGGLEDEKTDLPFFAASFLTKARRERLFVDEFLQTRNPLHKSLCTKS